MRRATIFCAAVLLTTGGVATYATTPSGLEEERQKLLSITPYAELSSGKQLLLFVSQAESLVYKGDRTFAKMHINEALSAAARLPSKGQKDEEQLHRLTILTLADGAIERQLMVVQPENINAPLSFPVGILPEDYAISRAEVQYVHAGWNKEKLLITLNALLRGIEKGKNVSVDFAPLHAMLLDGHAKDVSARRAAQDHIALARALIHARAYEPAKAAMTRAQKHIDRMADSKDSSPQRFEDIATIRNEMESVNNVIERDDPGGFRELDKKMEQWWNLLS